MSICETAHMLDNMLIQIWYMIDEETCGYVNDSFATFHGMKKEDIQYKKLFNFLSCREAEVCIENNRSVFTIKNPIHSEEWCKNSNGEMRLLSINKSPIFDNNGNVKYIICSADDITENKRKEEELQKYRENLEKLVRERTKKLEQLNEELKQDIYERKKIELSLKKSEKLLQEKAKVLEETNIALKVLIEHQHESNNQISENILSNVKNLVLPYIDKLKNISHESDHKIFLDIIEKNLMEILNPFAQMFTKEIARLSGTEVRIAHMTYEEKTASEIAEILCISDNTVKVHKKHIREKLGIKSQKVNLRTYLTNIFD